MHRFMQALANTMAVLGGIVLSVLILLTCASVVGRTLNSIFHSDLLERIAPGFSKWMIEAGVGPINGDFELVEAGVAFAIFAFIPLCQLTGGHASVDILSSQFPMRVQRALEVAVAVLFAAVLVLLAVQLFNGMEAKRGYGETTFLLQFPIWWAYAASLIGAVVTAVVGVYVAGVRIWEVATGRSILATGTGAEH